MVVASHRPNKSKVATAAVKGSVRYDLHTADTGIHSARPKGDHFWEQDRLADVQKSKTSGFFQSRKKSQAINPGTVSRISNHFTNQLKKTKNTKRDRVGINVGRRTEPREGSSSDDRRSSGDAPVKCQKIGCQDQSGVHANLAEWGAPRQRDGSKEPPPCPQTIKPSSEH